MEEEKKEVSVKPALDPRMQRRESKFSLLTREEMYAGVEIFKLMLPLFSTDDTPEVSVTNRSGSIKFKMAFTSAMVDSVFGAQGPDRLYTVFAKAKPIREGVNGRDITLKLRTLIPKQDW